MYPVYAPARVQSMPVRRAVTHAFGLVLLIPYDVLDDLLCSNIRTSHIGESPPSPIVVDRTIVSHRATQPLTFTNSIVYSPRDELSVSRLLISIFSFLPLPWALCTSDLPKQQTPNGSQQWWNRVGGDDRGFHLELVRDLP